MRDDNITLNFSLKEVESLFTALHLVDNVGLSNLEKKAVSVLRERLYYAIENYVETPAQKEARLKRFFAAFHKVKSDRRQKEPL